MLGRNLVSHGLVQRITMNQAAGDLIYIHVVHNKTTHDTTIQRRILWSGGGQSEAKRHTLGDMLPTTATGSVQIAIDANV